MSGDGHTNETRELNLDAIAEWFEGKAENPDTLQDVSEWHAVRDLVAEVRHLRAKVERVEALADKWNETPDYAQSDYDRGRVEQRHDMTEELLTALDAEVSS